MKCMRILSGVMFVLFVTGSFAYGVSIKGTVIEVQDGDTVVVETTTKKVTVDLVGSDAPELQQPYGSESKLFLGKLVFDKKVKVQLLKLEKCENTCGEVFLTDGYLRSVNREMVKEGYAWSSKRKYKHLEKSAREKKLGLWVQENPESPAEYRKTHGGMKIRSGQSGTAGSSTGGAQKKPSGAGFVPKAARKLRQ